MRNKKDEIVLTSANTVICAYFLALFMAYRFELSGGTLQVFVELSTIPMLILQLVFLVLGILHLSRKPGGVWMKASLIALFICSLLTIGSFFI